MFSNVTDIITGIFCFTMFSIYWRSYSKTFKFSVSNVLTALGILGTFVGVCIGLYYFDVNNIQESIPNLLNGLKTAFITSVVGMFFSILHRVFPPDISNNSDSAGEVVTIETLAQLQKDSNQIQESIRDSLTGDGDSTLLTQIQKLRTTFSDKQDVLIDEFKTFAEKMTKHNMDALTEAIQGLITDFNEKITEQFGENFKELNRAVEKLVTWQERYKQQVELMIQQLDLSTKSIHESEKSLEKISNNSQSLIGLSSQLEKSISVLTMDLDTFAGLAETAKQSFPIIESNIEQLTTNFSDQIKKAIQTLNSQTEFQQQALENQTSNILKTQENVFDQLTSSTENTNQQIQKMIADNADRITNQIEALDKALGEELEKTISTLGSQLTSLSTKFVQDYTPLTDRLKEVVEISKGV